MEQSVGLCGCGVVLCSLFLSNMAKAENTLGTGCIMFLCALRGEWKDSITVSLPANCSDLFWVCR